MTLRHDLCVFGKSVTRICCRLARYKETTDFGHLLEKVLLKVKNWFITSERGQHGTIPALELDEEMYFILFWAV